jgi:hypothetical protein
MPPKTPTDARAAEGPKASRDGAPRTSGRPRAPVLTATIVVLVLLSLAGAWLTYHAFTRPLSESPDRTELLALDAQLTKIQDSAEPIAAAFTSEAATAVIDVGAYRTRIARLRDLVDSTNDLAVTSPDALDIRDLLITGGSQIVAGMSDALDALAANEASATTTAASEMDEGVANLQTARQRLGLLLGRPQTS